MLCAPIREDSVAAIEEANLKADLIELRLDLFTPKDLSVLRRACQKRVIFKVLRPDQLIENYAPDYLDLPFGTAYDGPLPRICSFHDEEKTPDDLEALLTEMQSTPAHLYKIATLAHSTSDALRMLNFVRKHRCLGLCMGEFGAITRILAPIVGAPWTYAPLQGAHQTAEGQILLDELVKTYRYRALTQQTALYGLIGDPITQSPSQVMHNFTFPQLGVDAVYVKMRVKKEEIASTLPLLQKVGFRGLSVTMPLKEVVQESEVINTIRITDQGMETTNTDGEGALNALERHTSVAGKKVVILGVGGAAKAVQREAMRRGADVRMVPRAEMADFASGGYDILINGTPLCPIDVEKLLEGRIVMDMRSLPRMTPLLEGAERKRCTLVFGVEMFIYQALKQYEHWGMV